MFVIGPVEITVTCEPAPPFHIARIAVDIPSSARTRVPSCVRREQRAHLGAVAGWEALNAAESVNARGSLGRASRVGEVAQPRQDRRVHP